MQIVEPVRTDRNAIGRGRVGDPPEFGHTTKDSRVGLQDHRRVLVHQILEPPASDLDLAGRHRHAGALGQLGVQTDRVGRERLLHPVRIGGLVGGHVAQRVLEIGPGVVGVKHDVYVGPDRLACRLHPRCFLAHRETTHLDLDRVETHLDVAQQLLLQTLVALALEVVAARCVRRHRVLVVAAEQFEERQPRCFGVVVPERDVQHRERPDRRAGAAVQ